MYVLMTKYWVSPFLTYNLEIRNADIEALIHIGMPHNPNIGNEKGPKVTLKDIASKSKREGTSLVFLYSNNKGQ